jgi:hypothetical protein
MTDSTSSRRESTPAPSRRRFLGTAVSGAAGAAAMAAPMIAVAQSPIVLKMQGAWGAKDIFNEMAEEYVKRVNDMAGGRLRIDYLVAGAVVKPFEVMDAVNKGVLDAGHHVPVYWYGKSKVAGESNTTANKWAGAGQYDYNLSPKMFVFGKLGLEGDNLKGVDLALRTSLAGAIYKVNIDATHPLGFGFPGVYYSMKRSDAAFNYLASGWNVGVIPADGFVSGFVGHELKPRLTETLVFGTMPMGRGTVVVMVDNPLFRALFGSLGIDPASAVHVDAASTSRG